jgi:hypothetical protein
MYEYDVNCLNLEVWAGTGLTTLGSAYDSSAAMAKALR